MKKISFLFFWIFLCFSTESFADTWFSDARKLSGESESVRIHALHRLRNFPSLEKILKQNLHAHAAHYEFALDVISTLKLKSLLTDLIDSSAHDETGMAYLALISLTDKKNHQQIKLLFQNRLQNSKCSSVSKMILLDALMRMNQPISIPLLTSLLGEDSTPEVRSAALYYIRGMTLRQKNKIFLPLLEPLIHEKKLSSQFQAQLAFLLRELESVAL